MILYVVLRWKKRILQVSCQYLEFSRNQDIMRISKPQGRSGFARENLGKAEVGTFWPLFDKACPWYRDFRCVLWYP